MRARGILAASIVVLLALGGLAGCSKKLRPVQNLLPETYVNIQGPVDTVNHRVHLYWYGTDPDGSVVGYVFRWVYPPPASQDPAWVTLLGDDGPLRTDSLFTMMTEGGTGDTVVVMPRFEIYAIDNEGGVDPTPAVQTFQLRNFPPVVWFANPLGSRDSTYASATVSWEILDPDGGGPNLRYRLWLDGNRAGCDSTTEQTFTVPSARFLQDGAYRSGPRTLYVQAVDDGGLAGDSVGMTWYVRAPGTELENNQGRLLVIDDLPTGGNDGLYDSFYRSVYSLLPAGTYDVIRLQFNPNIFRSGGDVAQTFRQFKAVLWYRGDDVGTNGRVSPLLGAYEDSIGAYLDAGGKLYVDGLYLIKGLNTPGAFSEDFVSRRLGSTRLINCFALVAGILDSTAGWSSRAGSRFRSSVYGESFSAVVGPKVVNNVTGAIRGFAVTDTNYVALWAMDGQLSPANTGFEVPVGVTVPQGMGGRIVLVSTVLRFAPSAVATRLLHRILYNFDIGMPPP
jgi:hypothetical protein